MKTEFERAYVTAHGKVAVLTLNHPEAMNAAGVKLVHGASKALDFILAKDSGFRSGANLSEREGAQSGAGHSLETVYHPFLRKLRDLPIPFVTAVNGAA